MEPQQPAEGAPAPEMQPVPMPEAPAMSQQPQPMAAQQQPMMAAPQPMQATAAVDPGKGMGIASLILAFFIPLVGLIFGIIAKGKSKKVGLKNGLALAGIIISIIGIVWQVIVGGIFIAAIFTAAAKCKDLGPGTHYENGTTITCS